MTELNTRPFAGLTPDCILGAIESLGLIPDGRLVALNSYENRVYQIGVEKAPPLVVKFYRTQRWSDAAIKEEHGFVRELAECEIPVVPAQEFSGRSLHEFSGFRFAVFPRRGGRAPELDDPATLQWMGRFLGRIHAVGGLAEYRHRPALDIRSFGEEPRQYLLDHDFIPPDLLAAWSSVSAQAIDAVRHCFADAGAVASLRLHGDCHAGNVLWNEGVDANGPHFVDFDDSRMGPAIQDLWMLLSGERDDMQRQLDDLLSGYESFCTFDTRQLLLVEALRTLRLMHYSAWIARRWHDPAFPAAFPWFNTQHYWQDRILELREQVALMGEVPLQWH